MKKLLLTLAVLIISGLAGGSVIAQSNNRDHPTPLVANELNGNLRGRGVEWFYSFTAGPGDLTITVDVKSSDGTLAMPFELLSANGADALLCCEFAQADSPGQTGRTVKTIKLRRRQTVILHLTENENQYTKGTFRVRLAGAVSLAASAEGNRSGRADRDNGHNRMGMPASGTLVIRMKDGSTKEIDLSLVQNVAVEP